MRSLVRPLRCWPPFWERCRACGGIRWSCYATQSACGALGNGVSALMEGWAVPIQEPPQAARGKRIIDRTITVAVVLAEIHRFGLLIRCHLVSAIDQRRPIGRRNLDPEGPLARLLDRLLQTAPIQHD